MLGLNDSVVSDAMPVLWRLMMITGEGDTESGEREDRIAAGSAPRDSLSPTLLLPGEIDSSKSDGKE